MATQIAGLDVQNEPEGMTAALDAQTLHDSPGSDQ